MNKMSALLSTAILSGLLAGTAAYAEDSANMKKEDSVAAGKNGCNGKEASEKNSCKGETQDQMAKKKKKSEKNSCKNSCGAEKKAETATKEETK